MATLEPACPNCGEMMLDGRSHLSCQSRRERIASLERTVGEQADQIGGLTSELERARWQADMNETHGRNLKHENCALKQQLTASQVEAAALRLAIGEQIELWELAASQLWEVDSSFHRVPFMGVHDPIGRARNALATPSAAAERVRLRDATIRECLEGIIENRIADGGVCVRRVADCDCSECLARTALAALDATTEKKGQR